MQLLTPEQSKLMLDGVYKILELILGAIISVWLGKLHTSIKALRKTLTAISELPQLFSQHAAEDKANFSAVAVEQKSQRAEIGEILTVLKSRQA